MADIYEFATRQARAIAEDARGAEGAGLEGGGGGDHTSGMEARIAKLEAIAEGMARDVRTLHDDFRMTWNWMIGACGIAVIAIGAMYLRFDGQFNSIDHRLTVVEGKVDTMGARLDRMDTKLDILVDRLPAAPKP